MNFPKNRNHYGQLNWSFNQVKHQIRKKCQLEIAFKFVICSEKYKLEQIIIFCIFYRYGQITYGHL